MDLAESCGSRCRRHLNTRRRQPQARGRAPFCFLFLFLHTFFGWRRRSHAGYCSGPPPRRGPKLRIVLWSPTLNIHGQGRLCSQPWGRARSHALSPAGPSPSLREPRGGQTLSLSGLSRGFIGWWNWRSAFYVERRSSSPPRGPAWVTRAQPAERCPLATRTSRGAATLTLAVDAQVHTSLTRQ